MTIKLCNPYAFPLFVEVIGIEASIDDNSSCDVPLEVNSSRGFDLPPSLNGSSSVVSADLSVTPTAPGVISIKVCNLRHHSVCLNIVFQGIWTRCCNVISLHRVDSQGSGLSDALPVPPESGVPPPLPSSSCSVDVTPLLPRLFIEPPPVSGALFSGEIRHLSFTINATGAIDVSALMLAVEPPSGFSWDNQALQRLLPLKSGSCINLEVVTDAAIASEIVSFVFTYSGAEQSQFQRQITLTMDLSVQTGKICIFHLT